MINVGIIGCGFVGGALKDWLEHNNPISINYSDEKLRILVEEYITQQNTEFTLKGICSYILYWAMEDGKVAKTQDSRYESSELRLADQERIRHILDAIICDGRIAAAGDGVYGKL